VVVVVVVVVFGVDVDVGGSSSSNSCSSSSSSGSGKNVKQSPYNPIAGLEAPRFQDNQHMKVVSLSVCLSAILTVRLNAQGNIPGTHFCYRLSQPQGHSAAGRIR